MFLKKYNTTLMITKIVADPDFIKKKADMGKSEGQRLHGLHGQYLGQFKKPASGSY